MMIRKYISLPVLFVVAVQSYIAVCILTTLETATETRNAVVPIEDRKVGAGKKIKILLFGDLNAYKLFTMQRTSVECYAGLQGYETQWLFPSPACVESSANIFFQKICTIYEQMVHSSNVEWFVVLDGDNFVMNPNHRIESFLDDSKDVIHFLRFHNNEVAAGNYIVRNTEWGRNYIKEWYGLQDVNKYSGMNADNGALHFHLLHHLAPSTTKGWKECKRLGMIGGDYGSFVACFHHVVKQTGCVGMDWPHIRITHGAKGIFIDGWSVGFKWSNRTFMHHAVKKNDLSNYKFEFVCDESWDIPETNRVSQEEYDLLVESELKIHRQNFFQNSWDDASCIENDGKKQ
mmetsp:Transcript_14824/g.34021  ORF Transcript_14824/g.34021 Transcript_14824/m.34021 type:complete len:346 (-) Transcript_14824:414-1451(-)